MSKPSGRQARQRLLNASASDQKAKPLKVNGASRAGLPGFGDAPASVQPKRPQVKLNTPTKRSSTASTTPPPPAAACTAGNSRAQQQQGAQHTAAADPYDFPADGEDDDLVINNLRSSTAAAAKTSGRSGSTGGSRLAGLLKTKATGTLPAGGSNLGRGGINAPPRFGAGASRQLFGASESPFNFSSISGVNTTHAAGHGAAATHATGSTLGSAAQNTKQTGIKRFTVPQALLGSPTSFSGKLPAGMVNHGNTCYLNAVLQALLSIPCLARDLTSDSLQQLKLPEESVTHAVYECLRQYRSSCSGAGNERSGCAISPAVVSAAMARLSPRWGSCRQEDAHEFLTALLDAIQTEVLAAQHQCLKHLKGATCSNDSAADQPIEDTAMQDVAAVAAAAAALPDEQCDDARQHHGRPPIAGAAAVAYSCDDLVETDTKAAAAAGESGCSEAARAERGVIPHGPWLQVTAARCPASRNFSGCLQHTLTCTACGHVTSVKEQFNHLSLDLPPAHAGSSSAVASQDAAHQGQATQSQQQQQQQQNSDVDWMLSGGLNQTTAATVASITGANGGSNGPQYVPDLQSLLANFFAPETLDKACEACGAASAQHSLAHAVRRLPRVLVVHLKRFQWEVLAGGTAICRKLSTRVKPDEQLHLAPVCCPGRPVPPLLAELMPAGLLQAAQAACDTPRACNVEQNHCRDAGDVDAAVASCADAKCCGGLSGAKRSRSEGDAAAAVADGSLDDMQRLGGSKQQKQGQHLQQKQHRQPDLNVLWGSAAANGSSKAGVQRRSNTSGQQVGSRLARMAEQQQQQGRADVHDADAPGLGGQVVSSVTSAGCRHTDFTQLQKQQEQAEHTSSLQLPRNNSSTHVVDLVGDDEDDELQKALALSLETAAVEEASRTGLTDVAASDNPAARATCNADVLAGCMATADDLPEWMNGTNHDSHTSGVVSDVIHCNSHGIEQVDHQLAASKAASRQPLQPLQHEAVDGAPDMYRWVHTGAATGATGDTGGQQHGSGVGLSGGCSGGSGAGLSGGLALSDDGSAPASGGCNLQQAHNEHSYTAGMQQGCQHEKPSLALHLADDSLVAHTPPNTPPKLHRPAAGGFIGDTNAAGAGLVNPWSNNSGLLEGIGNMSEEEQMKCALAQSLLDQGGGAAPVDAAADPAATGLGLVGNGSYDEDAALAAALAASAAEHDQALQMAVEQRNAAADPRAASSAEKQQHQGTSSGGDGAAAAAAGDDDAVVVADGCAAEKDAQQPSLRLPMVRLVEDSDIEDDGAQQSPTEQQQAAAMPSAPAAKATADSGHGHDACAMQIDPPKSADNASAEAAIQQEQQCSTLHWGKENHKAEQQQENAGNSKPQKKQRRPLGEILCSRDASKANSRANIAAAMSASEPPVKRPAVAAAVAASEAAAAAATATSGGSSDELAKNDAAAAAQVAGAWPQENAALYQLRAVVRHKGPLASSGHFVSEVMSDQQGGQWFHYDDSFVQPTTFKTVVRRCEADGYLFFYVNSAILGRQQQCKSHL